MKTIPEQVLAALKEQHLSTTGVIGLFGHIQLAHAIHKLRKAGHVIRTKRVKYMNNKTYAQYHLEVPEVIVKKPTELAIGVRVRHNGYDADINQAGRVGVVVSMEGINPLVKYDRDQEGIEYEALHGEDMLCWYERPNSLEII